MSSIYRKCINLLEKLINKSLKALEYNRILELLSEECSSPESILLALSLTPFDNMQEAVENLSQTDDACRLCVRFGAPSFKGIRNQTNALHRANLGSMLQAVELLEICILLANIRSLKRYHESSGAESTCLDGFFKRLSPNKFLEDKISFAIISEEEISDGASAELGKIRRQIKITGARVREQLDKIIRSPAYSKYLQEPIVTIRQGRFVVPVKAECRSDVPGLVHDTSSSGATIFIEPMSVVETNNDLKVLYSKEEKEVERILFELSAQVGEFAETIKDDMQTAVMLDFIFARAKLAFKMKASAPKLTENGIVELRKARHPLINIKKAVPVDIRLGGEFDCLVITGPNTGGKTVALKTLGLLSLMAMSGLMIPAGDNSSISFFNGVLADIGDEQSIEQSLSTFSSHMTNIIDILSDCGPNTLVLLDELGSGTDPVEGAALAVAILEHLKATGAKVAATTHYAELKVYAIETAGVENACCEFDVQSLKPTFRLLIGVPGRSNAFAISQRLGLNVNIIERAKDLVSSENSRFEDVVSGLEEKRQQMELEKQQAANFRIETQALQQEAEKLKKDIELSQEKELERARQTARRIVEKSRAQAQTLLDELDELKKMRDSEDLSTLRELAKSQISLRLKELELTADPVSEKNQEVYKLPRELITGDTVLITSISKKGTVLKVADSSGNVEVQAGIIKTRVHISNLQLLTEKKADINKKYTVSTNIDRSKISAKAEIDIRGQNAEEALIELDRFIDDAQLASLSLISIIHGKGTGVLRSAVQQHLRAHRSIKSYRLGRYGEGESGVTIAQLK